MSMRTRPRHRTREWAYGDAVYRVDQDFPDDTLLRANQLIPGIGGELRSVCAGHAPSELALNGGRNTGGGTVHGHLRFAVPRPWEWLPIIVELSWLPDTAVHHNVEYVQGQPTAYVEMMCLIRADTRNLPKRLQWWDVLLTALAHLVKVDQGSHP
jgi:hypothetical protein